MNGWPTEYLYAIAAIVGIILLIFAPLIAQLMQFAVSRQREYLADAQGALLTLQYVLGEHREHLGVQLPLALVGAMVDGERRDHEIERPVIELEPRAGHAEPHRHGGHHVADRRRGHSTQ